jgi:glycogen(starch) synthase
MPSILKDYPKCKLLILGVGDLEELLYSLVDKLEIKDNVIIVPKFVSEEERILHYAASDVVILPSLYEPFGIVCTEAMSMGKPVVVGAKGVNGMAEQIICSGENICGYHINPYDPLDIAWGVKEILKMDDIGEHLGKNGRNRVIKEFTWDVVTKKTLNIYQKL